MKPFRLLLIQSLLGNVWLAARVSTHVRAQPETPAPNLAVERIETTPLAAPAPVPERTFRATAQDLRAAGLSPALVERILTQMLNESEPVEKRDYWQTSPRIPTSDRLRRETEREQAPRDALGDDHRFGAKRIASLRKAYGDYTPEQLDQIDALLRDYKKIGVKVRAEPTDAMARREMNALLTTELETDLLNLLGPEGFFDYQVRNSPNSPILRHVMGAFSPTESEFRDVFRLYTAANRLWPELAPVRHCVPGFHCRSRQPIGPRRNLG